MFASVIRHSRGVISAALLLAACGGRPSEAIITGEIGGMAAGAPVVRMDSTEKLAAPDAAAMAVDPATASAQFADRLVTYNASITLVVDDPAASMQKAAAIAAEFGGFVVSSNIYQVPPDMPQPRTPFEDSRAQPSEVNGVMQANLTMRVPAERRVQATERLRQLALDVRGESLSGQDITQEFSDLSARLRNLEAAETRLMAIMEGAATTIDVLAVYRELVTIREQLEIIRGQKQYFEQSAKMSLISVELLPSAGAQPVDVDTWQPLLVLKLSLAALLNGLQGLVNWVIYILIAVLPLVLLVVVPVWLLVRRWRRNRTAAAK
ncbi:MAG: hypothetical protein RLY92_396 [Chloroflexota bacterium]